MYIAIEGNIGAGKASFCKALAKEVRSHFLPEKMEKKRFLSLF